MATYLLTWNPKRWHWDEADYADTMRLTRRGELVASNWSCGNTRRITAGDRLFLLRQGSDRGLIGAGFATSGPYADVHWDESRQDEKAWYVRFQCEVLLTAEDRLPIEQLQAADLGVPWNNLVASGIHVPEDSESQLEELWHSHLVRLGWQRQPSFSLPDEVAQPERYWEGATQTVRVNHYERNARAREACIEHYGPRCVVCGLCFVEVYGEIGEGYAHVHHLRDLASIGEEYEVDPIRDMRPVCPNCHAMLHTEAPAMSIERLRAIVTARRAGASKPRTNGAMRALSIRQPHAEAIMRGVKPIEFRSKPTNVRGRIHVYAALGRYSPDEEAAMMGEYGIVDVACDDLPRGVLIGTVELWDCTGTDGDYHWHVRNPERAEKLIAPTNHPQPSWFNPF